MITLYGYSLENNSILGTSEFKTTEFDVEEKPKTYKTTNRFPFIGGESLKKEDIGVLIGCRQNTIYLLEPNVELAKSMLREKYEVEHQKAISEYNGRMSALKQNEADEKIGGLTI